MTTVHIRSLGLAAYLKTAGCKLVTVEDNQFVYESDRSEREWQVEYLNSCCYKHDSEVMSLRKLKTRNIN